MTAAVAATVDHDTAVISVLYGIMDTHRTHAHHPTAVILFACRAI